MKTTIVKIEGNNIEYVLEGGQEVLEAKLADWVKTNFVKLGDAELTVVDGMVTFCQMVVKQENIPFNAKAPTQKPTSNQPSKWEDDMVTFEDLLTKAHELKQPFSIHTDMITVDLEKKYALFKARINVIGKDGNESIFTGHGDATIDNVKGDFIKPHFIRMAETRAIVRALRWYTNNGVAEEEKQ